MTVSYTHLVFVLCEIESGSFRPNIETDESAYFGLEELPILAKEKNNEEQIRIDVYKRQPYYFNL